MTTVDQLSWILMGLLVVAAAGTLLLMRWHYVDLCREVERDAGWHRMWHERIYEDEDHGRD